MLTAIWGVASCVQTPMTVNQYSAMASATFNIGVTAFCGSTMARKANEGDRAGSCKALLMWVYAGGRKIQGLVNRRNAEYRLCMTP